VNEEFSVTGRRVVVVGAARSGIAAALLLARRAARVTLMELKPEIQQASDLQSAGVGLQTGSHDPETLRRADLIVLSPGVPPHQPGIEGARAAGVPVSGEVELASRWVRGRVVAITGTKGKSTTATLTGRMCQEAGLDVLVGGNIGTPLSAQVEASSPDTLHVVETSSFQLESIETFHPYVAVLLNFSPDHLDRHADEAEYAAAKSRIFVNQDQRDWAVINADDPQALALARQARAQRFPFATMATLDEGMVVEGGLVTHRTRGQAMPLIPLSSVRLIGRHLVSDVLAAASVARIVGVPAEAMVRAVEGFSGLEHALEPVGEVGGVRFVNDSKATNIEAARRAIESFDGDLVPIMGGRFKGGDWRDLREPLGARARVAVAIGEAAPQIRDALGDLVAVINAGSMASAVRMAYLASGGRGTVLLAPACASFDMFTDYAERGRVFKSEVARLAREEDARREQ
jgi:UDP-N-acetylmuramoylalanine--D-glutamate ligase